MVMMVKLMKILPVLAIVAGIGGAFGFGAKQDPCETVEVGYEYTPTTENPVPPGPPGTDNGTTLISGTYLNDYFCDAPLTNVCRWVYSASSTPQWRPCPGERKPINR